MEADLFKFVHIEDLNIHMIYIPVKSEDVLIVLNVEEKEFWYYNANPSVISYKDAHDRGTRCAIILFRFTVALKLA